MAYWWIPMAISAISSMSSASSASSQNTTQSKWNTYNALMSDKISALNRQSSNDLGIINATQILKASQSQQTIIDKTTEVNSQIINDTVAYNNSLLDEEERLLWEAADLDIENLQKQRARERGAMVAAQGASGTVIGEGSNKDVVVDQMAQEALDTLVIRHNADIQAASINNAKARNSWEGEMQIKKMVWEGNINKASIADTAIAQAASIGAQTLISNNADYQSSRTALTAGLYGSTFQYQSNQSNINNQFYSSMGQSISSGISSYYSQKTPQGESDSLMI